MFATDLLVAHAGERGGVSRLCGGGGRERGWVDLPHAVFLVASAHEGVVYALHGTASAGFVSVIDVGRDGLTVRHTLETAEEPCHATMIGDRHLAVACYAAGRIDLFTIEDDGALAGPTRSILLQGSGPDRDRQDAAHPHFVAAEEDGSILVVDLGCDTLWHIENPLARPHVRPHARAVGGAGPRHAIDLDHLRVVTDELSGHISVFAREDARLVGRAAVSAAAMGAPSYPSDLALVPGTRLIAVGVRGRSAVSILRLDEAGTPTLCEEVSVPGSWVQQVLPQPGGVVAVDRDGGRLLEITIDPERSRPARWRELRGGMTAPMWALPHRGVV